MAAAANLDEIEEVNANCILMANLQQASTSGTQSDKAPVYDSDESAEYTELLEPIPEPQQVLQNDSNVTFVVSSVEQGGGTVEQHPADVKLRKSTRSIASKQITALNEEISNLNKQILKEKSTVSSLQEEKKRLKSDFKIREDELLD
ncbi:hypothetical protein Tco_0927396, partial [Tanacetum coccineum]